MLTIISMFGLFRAAKFWVAFIMALAEFARVQWGVDLGLDEATVSAIMGGVTALLVWLIPNADPKKQFPKAPKGPGLF